MSTNSIQATASNPYIKDLDEYRKLYEFITISLQIQNGLKMER